MTLLTITNSFISIITIIAILIIGIMVISFIFRNNKIIRFIGNNAVLFSFVVSFTASLGSLIYSEIIGFTPCKLCWYQRIFMYPQVVLFVLALWKKDKISIRRNSLWLSIIGAVISLYHNLLQWNIFPESTCSAAGATSCTQRYIVGFDFITIPIMALTAFILLIMFMLCNIKIKKHGDLIQ